MAEPELAALAESQGGLVTRRQARDHLTREQLKHRLATGRLVTVRWGIYRFAGVPPAPFQDLRAASLTAGPAAIASHRSAAALWDLHILETDVIELTVPFPQWLRLPGVRCHQSTLLPPDHCTSRDGIPVTSVARTLVDLSSLLQARPLGRLVDNCVRRGMVVLPEVHAVHRFLDKPGRKGMAAIREVLARRPLEGYEPGGSSAELDLLSLLTDAGLPRPVQQFEVVVAGTVYWLDFAYPDLKIGIEYDGFAFHRLPSDLDHASARGNALALAGWTMLHFTVATPLGRIVREVRAARERALRAIGGSDPQLRGKVG